MPPGSTSYWCAQARQRYGKRPRALVGAVAGWAALGKFLLFTGLVGGPLATVVLCCWAVAAPGLVSGGVTIAVGLASLAMLWIALGAIMVASPVDHGVRLDDGGAPRLRELLDGLGAHDVEVRIDASLRLERLDRPGWGFLSAHGSWLRVGLPLLEILDEAEVRLLVERELGGAGLGPAAGRLVRLWKRWRQVVEAVRRRPGRELLKRFLAGYWPRFSSRAVLLARLDGLARDREVDAGALAEVVKRVAIARVRRHERWSELMGSQGASLEHAYASLFRPSGDSWERIKEKSWLSSALEQKPGLFETEPEVGARLENLASDSSLVPRRRPQDFVPAADSLIEAATLGPIRDEIGRRCQVEFEDEWRGSRRCCRADDPNGTPSRFLTARQRWRRISDLVRVDGLEQVQPEIDLLLGQDPDHSGALFLRGRYLAARDAGAARESFERAAGDPTLRGEVYDSLSRLEARAGNDREAARFRAMAGDHEDEMRLALIERNRVTVRDRFRPARLASEVTVDLTEALHREAAVQEAWLVAKEVEHFPEWRHHVLLLRLEWPNHRMVPNRDESQLLERIARCAHVDGHLHVCTVDGLPGKLLRMIRRRVEGSAIYRRGARQRR